MQSIETTENPVTNPYLEIPMTKKYIFLTLPITTHPVKYYSDDYQEEQCYSLETQQIHNVYRNQPGKSALSPCQSLLLKPSLHQ